MNSVLLSLPPIRGYIRKYNLLEKFSNVEDLFRYIANTMDKGKLQEMLELAVLVQNDSLNGGIGYINYYDPLYPQLLKNIPDPPALLFYKGNPELLDGRHAAVVGTRKPSPVSLAAASRIPTVFGRHNFDGVVSGLAMGIDKEAMLSSINCGMNTIGVAGTGLNKEYPWNNRDLYLRMNISDNCLLVSEYHVREHIHRFSFPQRNRIITGLATVVCVMEADLKSGAMSSASNAIDQNRELWIFDDPLLRNNAGGRKHIQDGAVTLTSGDLGLKAVRKNEILPDSFDNLPAVISRLEKQKLQGRLTETQGFLISA